MPVKMLTKKEELTAFSIMSFQRKLFYPTVTSEVSIAYFPTKNLVGDRCFSPDSHSEVHEEDIEFWWFPKPTDMEIQSMQRLQAKISKSKNGLQVWYNNAEGEPYEEYVGIKDILEKTPSEIIKHTLEALRKVRIWAYLQPRQILRLDS